MLTENFTVDKWIDNNTFNELLHGLWEKEYKYDFEEKEKDSVCWYDLSPTEAFGASKQCVFRTTIPDITMLVEKIKNTSWNGSTLLKGVVWMQIIDPFLYYRLDKSLYSFAYENKLLNR